MSHRRRIEGFSSRSSTTSDLATAELETAELETVLPSRRGRTWPLRALACLASRPSALLAAAALLLMPARSDAEQVVDAPVNAPSPVTEPASPAGVPSAEALLADGDAEDEAGLPAPTLLDLQARYNRALLDGVRGFRSQEAPGQIIVGDNTDPWGMTWTKCTNLGIDLLTTLVAERRGLIPAAEARQNVRSILDILRKLRTHRGIFPENIQIRGGIVGEVVGSRARFSSIDSAWVTLALSLVAAGYEGAADGLARDASALISAQDYGSFIDSTGALGAGYYVDVASDQKVEEIPFSYKDRNSEARPLLLALVGLRQLPASAWTQTLYVWDSREGLAIAKGWHFSAFVEMTGSLFFDEAKLAPRSLGKSHENYIQASLRVARRNGYRLCGYAPACDARNAYTEFGLDRPDSVSPYAAALLTLTGNAQAIRNLHQVLATVPNDGRPLPDGLDPRTGAVSCGVARLLDQGLLFLALNADVVRGLVQQTPWYGSAARRLQAMDHSVPPRRTRSPRSDDPPMSFLEEPPPRLGMSGLALLADGNLP